MYIYIYIYTYVYIYISSPPLPALPVAAVGAQLPKEACPPERGEARRSQEWK